MAASFQRARKYRDKQDQGVVLPPLPEKPENVRFGIVFLYAASAFLIFRQNMKHFLDFRNIYIADIDPVPNGQCRSSSGSFPDGKAYRHNSKIGMGHMGAGNISSA